jgi:hypothetical protein
MNVLKFFGALALLSIISYIFPFGDLIVTGVYWYALWKLVND